MLERADSEFDSLLEPESPTRYFRGKSIRQRRLIPQVGYCIAKKIYKAGYKLQWISAIHISKITSQLPADKSNGIFGK